MRSDDADRLRATRAFLASRAVTWQGDATSGDSLPDYAAAMIQAGVPQVSVVVLAARPAPGAARSSVAADRRLEPSR